MTQPSPSMSVGRERATPYIGYRNGVLVIGDVSAAEIADRFGTPSYCYSGDIIEDQFDAFRHGFSTCHPEPLIAFAVKANPNGSVLRTLAKRGAGADVVSGGELRRAVLAGIPAERIVFSGVGKSESEIADALEAGIYQINVESIEEARSISRIAGERGIVATVAVRVNPDIECDTHPKIATGRRADKFGIGINAVEATVREIQALPAITLCGLAAHIGSQLLDLAPIGRMVDTVGALVERLRSSGVCIDRVDVGGGLGINYRRAGAPAPSIASYCELVREKTRNWDVRLILEPGRAIVAEAGILLTTVIRTKRTADGLFIVLDAGMNDLMRPALYDAWHLIETARHSEAPCEEVTVVGPVCESGDTFAASRLLPPVRAGDLICIRDVGAYGATMANQYNSRDLTAEVLVSGGVAAVVRERSSLETLLAGERRAPWLS